MFSSQDFHDNFVVKDDRLYWKIGKYAGKPAGNLDKSTGYMRVMLRGKNLHQHRVIFEMAYGYAPEIIDHINGNRADNSLENLREVNAVQNRFNSKRKKYNAYELPSGNWVAKVVCYKEVKYLGVFPTEEEAVAVATKARRRYHKEHCYED